MAPKSKAKGKAKASAADMKRENEEAAEAEAAKALSTKRREDTEWAQAQLSALVSQRRVAETSEGAASIVESHKWHEMQLTNLLKCLTAKVMDVIPQGMREGIESYVSQCAEGSGVDVQSSFKEHHDIYADLPDMESVYTRVAETKGNLNLIEEAKAHDDCGWEPMEYFAKFYLSATASAGVVEVALQLLVRFIDKHTNKEGRRASKADGLEASTLMPAVAAAMRKHVRDSEVQRVGCGVIIGFALMDGQLTPMLTEGGGELSMEAMAAHPRVVDVQKAAERAMKTMALKAGPEDVELMAAAGIST